MNQAKVGTQGGIPFSATAITFAKAVMNSSLVPLYCLQKFWGATDVQPEEFLDLYDMSDDRARFSIFPLLLPDFYREQDGVPDDVENPLDHFLREGLELGIDPHPLVSFDWMWFSRPDLFKGAITPDLLVSIFDRDLVSPSPFVDLTFYRSKALKTLESRSAFMDLIERGVSVGLPVSPWIDLDFYRDTYDDVPRDRFDALLHLVRQGDSELRAPSKRLDPAWYQEQHSTPAFQIDRPLYHFLRWGRFQKLAPAPGGTANMRARRGRSGAARVGFYTYAPSPSQLRETYERMRHILSATHRRSQLQARHLDDRAAVQLSRVVGRNWRKVLAQSTFSETDTPKVEVVVSVEDRFIPAVRSIRSLSTAVQQVAAKTGERYGVGLRLNCRAGTKAHDLARKHFGDVDGVEIVDDDSKAQAFSAPVILFVAAGVSFDGDALEALISALSERTHTAAVPVLLGPKGGVESAGGAFQADGRPVIAGAGQALETCFWARARPVAWAPRNVMMVTRDLAQQVSPSGWAHIRSGDAVALGLELHEMGAAMQLVPGAAFHTEALGLAVPASPDRDSQSRRAALRAVTRTRVLAHYFPNFGSGGTAEGMTDWPAIASASPSFFGHYQPRVPSSLGFYDQNSEQVLPAQIALARRYGIDGFVLRYFNLTGTAVRAQVFRQLLSGRFGGFAHALCWDASGAEHWAYRATGTQAQSYGDDVLEQVLADAVRAASVDGAITLEGNPLFALAHADLLPDLAGFAAKARAAFAQAGFCGVHLAAMEPAPTSSFFEVLPGDFGFDSIMQNPIISGDGPGPRGIVSADKDAAAQVVDYRSVAQYAIALPNSPVARFPGVCVDHDETAQGLPDARVMQDVTPSALQAWMRTVLDQVDLGFCGDERLVFVNAWNDWSRGAYLEPDTSHGHAFLEAIRNARLSCSVVPRGLSAAPEPRQAPALAIFIHAYYLDVFEEILQRIVDENIQAPLFVTTPQGNEDEVKERLAAKNLAGHVFGCANHGRDVLPFLSHLQAVQEAGHKYILKVHTKKSPHREDGVAWRNELFAQFLNRRNLEQVVAAFERHSDLGIAGPEMHILPLDDHLVENAAHLGNLSERLGQNFENALSSDSFVAGTMFFARFSALVPVLKLGLRAEDFEAESGQVDGTLAHALERAFGMSARISRRRVASFEAILSSRQNRRAAKRSFHS